MIWIGVMLAFLFGSRGSACGGYAAGSPMCWVAELAARFAPAAVAARVWPQILDVTELAGGLGWLAGL